MNQQAYLLLDGGLPEAADLDTNSVRLDPPGGAGRAGAGGVTTNPQGDAGAPGGRLTGGWRCLFRRLRSVVARMEQRALRAAMDCALPLREDL